MNYGKIGPREIERIPLESEVEAQLRRQYKWDVAIVIGGCALMGLISFYALPAYLAWIGSPLAN